jgi:hypothetical protein
VCTGEDDEVVHIEVLGLEAADELREVEERRGREASASVERDTRPSKRPTGIVVGLVKLNLFMYKLGLSLNLEHEKIKVTL